MAVTVLDRAHRITHSNDFAATVRRGRRSGSAALVVHVLRVTDSEAPARVGFVVGRGVGNAVARNRVKRRLRHLVRGRLDALPGGATLVVRALPPAAGRSSAELGRQLDRSLGKVLAGRGTS